MSLILDSTKPIALRRIEDLDPIELGYIDMLRQDDPKLAKKAEIAFTSEPIIVANRNALVRLMLAEMWLLAHSNPLDDIKEYHGCVSDEPSSTVEAMEKAIQEVKSSNISKESATIVIDSISGDGDQIKQLATAAIAHMGLNCNGRYYSSLPRMNNESSPFRPPKRNRSKKRRR